MQPCSIRKAFTIRISPNGEDRVVLVGVAIGYPHCAPAKDH